MQQMPIDRWNKFELVVLLIDTLLYYEIPRLFQSDYIMLWNTYMLKEICYVIPYNSDKFNLDYNVIILKQVFVALRNTDFFKVIS